jgi:hypothetical protein
MTKEQVKTIMKIVDNNVEEVLDRYLSYDLVRRIKSEITSGVEWDLVNKGDE